jgi:vesicular inhibitory amino acid transporter
MLAYVALGGVMASVILIASVLWVGTFDGVGFHKKGVPVDWSGMPTAMSLYAFCFSGHAVFPMIYTGMRNRKAFPTVSKAEVLSPVYFVHFSMDLDKYNCYKVLFY